MALEVSQTQTMLALVNQGLGVALVPHSARAQQMANLSYRQIDILPRFSSEIFLSSLSRRGSALHDGVQQTIIDALADLR